MNQLTRFVMLPALLGAILGVGIILTRSDDNRPGFAAAVDVAAPSVVNIHTRTVRHSNPLCRYYTQLCSRFGYCDFDMSTERRCL